MVIGNIIKKVQEKKQRNCMPNMYTNFRKKIESLACFPIAINTEETVNSVTDIMIEFVSGLSVGVTGR